MSNPHKAKRCVNDHQDWAECKSGDKTRRYCRTCKREAVKRAYRAKRARIGASKKS